MDTIKRLVKEVLGIGLGAVAMLGVGLMCLTTQAQVTPTTIGAFSGLGALVEGSATSNYTSTAISVRGDRGISIMPILAGTNSSTALVTFTFYVSPDGTNYSTHTPFVYAVAMNGTTGVNGFTNWPPTLLQNVRYLKLKSIANAHTASVFITNVLWSVGN